MRLVPITADDEDLIVHLECDPEMMRHFGGPARKQTCVLPTSVASA